MDIFDFRNQVIEQYQSYVSSFVYIRDPDIHEYVNRHINDGTFWPDPLVQLNPNFEAGGSVADLVSRGILHPACVDIFALDTASGRVPLNLHRHQQEATALAHAGKSYVVTTGTGSGKSLTYMIPIIDHVLRTGSGKGIKAIVVYPMNALANSQQEELTKFLGDTDRLVTFKRYTGQESREEKDQVIADPPDILLTNYMMLELILTRQDEARLMDSARGLAFLVFDELHTYRGRQGADVSLLIRRLRNRLSADEVVCVGTSATMSSSPSYTERQASVARVASQIFGVSIGSEQVVGESLQRVTDGSVDLAAIRTALDQPVPSDFGGFISDPLVTWIEGEIGLRNNEEAARLERCPPQAVAGQSGLASKLSSLTGVNVSQCQAAVQQRLLLGHTLRNPATGRSLIAFRLHQFISKASSVYAPLTPSSERLQHLTLRGQLYAPGTDRQLRLYPLEFCRNCGHEYYSVRRTKEVASDKDVFVARGGIVRAESTPDDGYLYLGDQPWPTDAVRILERLPGNWLEEHRGELRVKSTYRRDLPRPVHVTGTGEVSDHGGQAAAFVEDNFKFCLSCGVSYVGRTGKLTKLASLSSEGRSTATTLISMAAVQGLRSSDLPETAHKVLSFTDNRQDASLQAGHFNDFVFVSSLRAGLARALENGALDHDEVAKKVFEALNLELTSFAADPTVRFRERDRTLKTAQDLIGYALFSDLAEGKRLALPNLERVDLVRFDYPYLRDVCELQELWENAHPALSRERDGIVELRIRASRALLDWLRQNLVIKTRYLDRVALGAVELNMGVISEESPLYIPPDEWRTLETASVMMLGSRPSGPRKNYDVEYLGPRGALGRFLVRPDTLRWNEHRLASQDAEDILKGLTLALSEFIEPVDEGVYQLKGTAFCWLPGDGTRAYDDPLRVVRTGGSEGPRSNRFFLDLYRQPPGHFTALKGAEHTAQIRADEREKREHLFKHGDLPVLFCSPTMELGVDISDLNVVHMRNVPPTPANYAQRSGRAGRSGQPALVMTYATNGNNHDQYFFRQPNLMVGGAVSTPRLDLGNEALVRSHIHAIWLSETNTKLPGTLAEILDVGGENPSLEVIEDLRRPFSDSRVKDRATAQAKTLVQSLGVDLSATRWYSDEWLAFTVQNAPQEFDRACGRWRDLYRSALSQLNLNNAVLADASKRHLQEQAKRLHAEANTQLGLLRNPEGEQSDFYTYRYLASEGFLPGYNFARLPLSAYIPGRRVGRQIRDSYLSRARFLAISEFGPGAIVYHNGAKYESHKVIVPARGESTTLPVLSAQRCEACGYLHHGGQADARDVCESCAARLAPALPNLFRMTSVATRRRERIGSDEEERQRVGFEIKSGIRFASRAGVMDRMDAVAQANSRPMLRLTYGDAATLWRINYGWRNRKNKRELGFLFDASSSQWVSQQKLEDLQASQSGSVQRVIPFVEDTRNVLLLQPEQHMDDRTLFTLMNALKNAVQLTYQLEDSELAGEVLPDASAPQQILLYEASEGGAGVLQELVFREHALAEVAREALALLHFNPQSGANLQRALHAKEDCVAACYDCLMTYGNQTQHELLDRHTVRDLLMQLSGGCVQGRGEVSGHLASLLAKCDSELERRWLAFLSDYGLHLPTHAQQLVPDFGARPDFSYETQAAVIFVDGPHHDTAHMQARDQRLREDLDLAGYTVVTFTHDQTTWLDTARRYAFLFGEL